MGLAVLVVKYETARIALLPSVMVMEPVEAVSAEPFDAYHAAFVGKLVLLRFPSAHVSSSMTTARLGVARPMIAATTRKPRKRCFIDKNLYCVRTRHTSGVHSAFRRK